jgi:hypothetical protein
VNGHYSTGCRDPLNRQLQCRHVLGMPVAPAEYSELLTRLLGNAPTAAWIRYKDLSMDGVVYVRIRWRDSFSFNTVNTQAVPKSVVRSHPDLIL